MKKADIGLIGLAVMGENLVLNMESKGYSVAVFNRTLEKVDKFIQGRAYGKNIIATHSLKELTDTLSKPRKIMLMVKAGRAVDAIIKKLLPLLDEGDIIIDGGNSFYQDTRRRTFDLTEKKIHFIGAGVSGGEEGALHGPSIMPGGNHEAWKFVESVFKSISAKVDNDTPCCEWIGPDGAGHFVKMVHNGIEYGDMQLICEIYFIMKKLLKMSSMEISKVFEGWRSSELNSYLIDITAEILAFNDKDGKPLVEKIKDTAGQKGTGKWTALSALDFGVPLNLITEAVFARFISSLKCERVNASGVFPEMAMNFNAHEKKEFIESLKNALFASKIVSYAQGFALMRAADEKYSWNLNYGDIALIWRGGCIIRSVFLNNIKEAFEKKQNLKNLMLDDYFKNKLISSERDWRTVISKSVLNGIPVPALSAALSYFDAYKTDYLPANLLQAQRDYFGAHSYERLDRPDGEFFHTEWI